MAEVTPKKYLDEAGLGTLVANLKNWVEEQAYVEETAAVGSAKYTDGTGANNGKKVIQFIAVDGETLLGEIDCTDFIKDGMVESVTVENGTGDNVDKSVLKITFNTDGKSTPIELPIEKIFNASNYLTKAEVEGKLAEKLDASTYNTEKETFATKTAVTTEIEEAIEELDLETQFAAKADATDLANYVKNTTYEADKATFETKENAAATYQPKGEYALKSEIPTDYYTKTEIDDMFEAISDDEIEELFNED